VASCFAFSISERARVCPILQIRQPPLLLSRLVNQELSRLGPAVPLAAGHFLKRDGIIASFMGGRLAVAAAAASGYITLRGLDVACAARHNGGPR
jgi:hypothetical protein